MPQTSQSKPLIVIVGQTASGKSALAMELAEKFDGEIICADARTIYKGMDIGTAKPSADDQAKVTHHLLDIITPDQPFTAAVFKSLATEAIKDIQSRKKLPIIVGGTGLYIDSVLFDFEFRSKGDSERRAELEKLSVEELQAELQAEGIPLPENTQNPRHLIRALETGGEASEQKPIRENTLVLGLEIEPEKLSKNIDERVAKMIEAGLRQEVNNLVNVYGWEAPGMSAIGYKEWRQLFSGEVTSESKIEHLIIKNTKDYAKRQKTWFRSPRYNKLSDSGQPFSAEAVPSSLDVPKGMPHSSVKASTQKSSGLNKTTQHIEATERNKSIQWAEKQSKAVDFATTFLNKTIR